MNQDLSVAETLERAADILETRGWTQGAYQTSEGFCSLGALRAVASTYPLLKGATVALADSLNLEPQECGCGAVGCYRASKYNDIAEWNDHPERTAAEVIDAFKMTAKELRNKAVAA